MKRYERGILVRVIVADESANGPIYPESVLQEAAARFTGRPIACNVGHDAGAPGLGRFVALEYHDRAVWGQLVGVAPDALVRMREGARARGIPELGVSINGMGRRHENGVVLVLESLSSIDIVGRSAPRAAAGGYVPFTEDGQPVPWERRGAYWLLMREARVDDALQRAQIAVAERRLQEAQRPDAVLTAAFDRAWTKAQQRASLTIARTVDDFFARRRERRTRVREAATLSHEEIVSQVLRKKARIGADNILATFDDHLIYQDGTRLYRLPFTVIDGTVEVGQPQEVTVKYVPLSENAGARRRLAHTA